MGLWQKAYNWIGSWTTPLWLKNLLQVIQDILVQVLTQVGKEAIAQIEAKIVEVSSSNKSNDQKFMIVFNFTKDLLPGVKDAAINLLIESLYNKFKQSGYIS